MSNKNLAIIFGGANSEYEVSLRSATSVINNAPTEKYNIILIGITKDGRWLRYTGDETKIIDNSWLDTKDYHSAILSTDRSQKALIEFKSTGVEFTPIDVIFPVLHGKNGEDGTIQGLFEIAGIPYVGCDVISSANCMDKEHTHILLENAGVKTARWHTVKKSDMANFNLIEQKAQKELGYPMFVKPANAGSSVGVSKANNREELYKSIELALMHDYKVLVEECIVGKEVECAVLGNQNPIAPTVGEIELGTEFYDYDAKYINDTAKVHIPARIPEEQAEQVKKSALIAYKALGCKGLCRIDFFALKDGSIILNEMNTLPGFTSISLYPKMIMHSGVTYKELISKLIDLALEG